MTKKISISTLSHRNAKYKLTYTHGKELDICIYVCTTTTQFKKINLIFFSTHSHNALATLALPHSIKCGVVHKRRPCAQLHFNEQQIFIGLRKWQTGRWAQEYLCRLHARENCHFSTRQSFSYQLSIAGVTINFIRELRSSFAHNASNITERKCGVVTAEMKRRKIKRVSLTA